MPRVNDPDPPPLKAPRARNPAPQHNPVFIWPTPNHADYLFWVEKNGDLPKNQSFAYGDAYSDSVKYPDHKLVFVSPQTEDAWSRWYYASPRINEDAYNWAFSQADIGGEKFDSVVRTYITLRSSFSPSSPAQGSTMPNVPAGKFSGSYVLSARREIPLDDELKSLFVAEQREWVKRTTISTITTDDTLGKGVKETVTLYYRGESIAGSTIEVLAENPSHAFWGIQADGSGNEVKQLTSNWWAVITTSSVDALLLSYQKEFPVKINLQLPSILTNVYVLWNLSVSNGTQDSEWEGVYAGSSYSLSCSQGDRSSAAAGVSPEVVYEIEEPDGRNLSATGYLCYMRLPVTEAQLLTKFNAKKWPVFTTKSHVIATAGQNLSVVANVQISASAAGSANTYSRDAGKSESSEVGASLNSGVTRIPPSIHPTIEIGGGTQMMASANAFATLSCTGVNFPSVSASKSAGCTAFGRVYPTVLPKTDITDIPRTGRYITNYDIKPFKDGRLGTVYVEVLDASIFAKTSAHITGGIRF